MYLPPHFREVDSTEIMELVEHFPLAALVCSHKDDFIVNHIPLLFVNDKLLIGHIAKENSLHQICTDGTKAVAIFNAEDSYISPNWYPSKQITQRQVPTWNYQVVHLHGHIRFDHAKKSKLSAVGKLTKKYEKIYSGEREWRMSDAPRDFLDDMISNIVAFTFRVEKTVAKSKLGQNKEEMDYKSVEREMRHRNKMKLSNAMKRFKNV